jgi:hypothetical protein
MHGSRWRREETRPVGPARAAQPRRLSPTLPVPLGRGAVKASELREVHDGVSLRRDRLRDEAQARDRAVLAARPMASKRPLA